MRPGRGLIVAGLVGCGLGLVPSTAPAQTASLGGYGAMAGGGPAMGGIGPGMVAPFGGRFGASMPSSLGAGGVAFRPRPTAGMGARRAAFTVDPMGGGMSGSGSGSARRPFGLSDLGPGGFSGATVGGRAMSPASGRGVLPPSFGAPFRPPTTLPALGGSGSGTAM